MLTGWLALGGGDRNAGARNAISPEASETVRSAADAATPTQSMRIDVRGAMAHVAVTRRMPCQGERRALGGLLGTSAADAVLDVALPEHAALLDVEVEDGNRFRVATPTTTVAGHDAYVEGLRSMGFTATRVVFPEDSTFRVRLACQDKQSNSYRSIKYSFSIPLEISEGSPRLTFPAAADLTAPRTRVQVTVSPAADVREISIAGAVHPVHASGAVGATEMVAVRSRWVVALQTARAKATTGAPAGLPPARLTARASWAHGAGQSGDMLASSIGAGAANAQPIPERVLFLIDRSRSVGAGGFEAERNLARRILELLPPSTRFDALFFDRGQQRLFPVARPATRAAITALEEQMVPARLSNGTDVAAALRAAGELLRREAADFGPRTLLVLLSDGAVGRPAAGLPLAQSLGALGGVELMVAALSVRLNDEPAVSDDERRILRTLASTASLGGVERALRVPEVLDGTTVPAILETLRTGGDVHGLALAQGKAGDAGKRARSGAVKLAEVLAPGHGASGVALLPRGLSPAGGLMLTPSGSARSEPRPLPVHAVAVDARWLAPLARPAPLRERVLVGPAVAAMVEPARPAPGGDPSQDPPRGYMERSVVRDALSLAFTPRARACYLNRSARTPAERDLAGKVRLALDLVRGEVGGVRVESSTLGHPAIESCLRDSAFAIEVPRAYRNDEAVTAILNLVFRPRTPDRRPTLQESTGRELDLLVEAALKAPLDAGTTPGTPDAAARDAGTPDAGTPDAGTNPAAPH